MSGGSRESEFGVKRGMGSGIEAPISEGLTG